MQVIPLYPQGVPRAAVQDAEPLERDAECTRCTLHKSVRTVCMPAEFIEGDDPSAGTLYAIAETPGDHEDRVGRPMWGPAGVYFRRLLRKFWAGNVVIDNATRCKRGTRNVTDKHITSCRGFAAATIAEAKPDRILALGTAAYHSLFDRSPGVFSSRKGFTWLGDVPIFLTMNPAAARRNKFVARWFEEDLQHALTVDVRQLRAEMPWTACARVVETPRDAREAVQDLRREPWITYDLESAGESFTEFFEVLLVSLCGPNMEDPWLWPREALASPKVAAPLLELLADSRVKKAPFAGKYDRLATWLATKIDVGGHDHDGFYVQKLLDPEFQGGLEVLQESVGMGGGKEEADTIMRRAFMDCRVRAEPDDDELAAIAARGTGTHLLHNAEKVRLAEDFDEAKTWLYAFLPREALLRYGAIDALSQARIVSRQIPELNARPGIKRIWTSITRPVIEGIEQIERWGVSVDRQAVEALESFLLLKRSEIEDRLSKIRVPAPKSKKGDADGMVPFNPKSWQQVQWLLFRKLRLKPTKDMSTKAEELEKIQDEHPVVKDIVDIRKLASYLTLYVRGFKAHIRVDGRIHPNIKPDGARTGRPSCVQPNLQNIPTANSEEGKLLRDVFIAPPGYRLLELDYSQIELRVAAYLSGDPKMIAIFTSGQDYHKRTAQLISQTAWGIPPDKVGPEHRRDAKIVNFGLLYGMTDSTLAAKLKCSKAQAARIRAAILGTFKVFAKWAKKQLAFAKQFGFIPTWWAGKQGRERPMWRVVDADDQSRRTAENGCVNTPVQGSASEYTLASISAIVEWILEEKLDARLVLTIHDSLLFEVEESIIDEFASRAHAIMTSWEMGDVPIVVDGKLGDRWGSMEEYEIKKAA